MIDSVKTQADKLFALTQSHLGSRGTRKTKIITITSGKGGVGKSTLTANIASILAQKGKKIAILDADIGLANMQVLFNLKPEYTLYDYIEKKSTLENTLLETGYENIVLCAGKSGYQYAKNDSSYRYAAIAEDIANLDRYDYLLIDTGAGLSEYVQEFLVVCDEVVAITSTDPSAITDVYALIKMVSLLKKRIFLVFNQTPHYKIGESITNSLKELALKNNLDKLFVVQYLGNIGFDLQVATTGRLRKLFIKEFQNSGASLDLQAVVNNLVKEIR